MVVGLTAISSMDIGGWIGEQVKRAFKLLCRYTDYDFYLYYHKIFHIYSYEGVSDKFSMKVLVIYGLWSIELGMRKRWAIFLRAFAILTV